MMYIDPMTTLDLAAHRRLGAERRARVRQLPQREERKVKPSRPA
jgi:hypothetical protein